MNDGGAGLFAVLTLLIGAAAVAVGVLSLFGFQYFESRAKNLAALAFGLALLVGTETVFMTSGVGGRYFSGQKLDVTECELRAERAFPLERRSDPARLRDEIVGCMTRAGYQWTAAHDHCAEAPLATNAFCYLPADRFARAIVAFQARFE